MAAQPVLLLDATERSRRLLQQVGPMIGGGLLTIGLSALLVVQGPARLLGALGALLGFGFFAWGFKLLVRWDVPYKGHLIRFQNSVVFGERLYIDEDRFQDDTAGPVKILSGAITTGEGVGDRITASSVAGIFGFKCRIEAAPSPRP